MIKFLKELLTIEKKPKKGLLAMEWVVLAYMLLTFLIIFLCYTKVINPHAMIWGRIRILVTTLLMWGVYRMIPCRLIMIIRIVVQMAFLSWWYPDTYEINRILPNFDPFFASLEQQVFGCQPALLFSQYFTHPVFSELMDLGYASYYPLIAVVCFFYAFCRYKQLQECVFILMASFITYYVIFIILPVTGPMFYYKAVGVEQIAKGVFPSVGDYFYFHQDYLTTPGWKDGFFYQMVVAAHDAGERPTAAFPSSHVGITTILMWLAWQARSKKLFLFLLPFYVLMCFATVYIQAHYAIDAIAGLITGTAFYWFFRCFKIT